MNMRLQYPGPIRVVKRFLKSRESATGSGSGDRICESGILAAIKPAFSITKRESVKVCA
jgi:hypothetical protein